MMYFEKLENLKYEHSTGQNKINQVFFDSLDEWLFGLNRQQANYINPVQFAQIYGLPFSDVIQLFNELTKRHMFNFFLIVKTMMGEVVTKANSIQELKDLEKKSVFIQDKNEYVKFKMNNYEISGWYKLNDLATGENKKVSQQSSDFFGGEFSNKNPSPEVSSIFKEMINE